MPEPEPKLNESLMLRGERFGNAIKGTDGQWRDRIYAPAPSTYAEAYRKAKRNHHASPPQVDDYPEWVTEVLQDHYNWMTKWIAYPWSHGCSKEYCLNDFEGAWLAPSLHRQLKQMHYAQEKARVIS